MVQPPHAAGGADNAVGPQPFKHLVGLPAEGNLLLCRRSILLHRVNQNMGAPQRLPDDLQFKFPPGRGHGIQMLLHMGQRRFAQVPGNKALPVRIQVGAVGSAMEDGHIAPQQRVQFAASHRGALFLNRVLHGRAEIVLQQLHQPGPVVRVGQGLAAVQPPQQLGIVVGVAQQVAELAAGKAGQRVQQGGSAFHAAVIDFAEPRLKLRQCAAHVHPLAAKHRQYGMLVLAQQRGKFSAVHQLGQDAAAGEGLPQIGLEQVRVRRLRYSLPRRGRQAQKSFQIHQHGPAALYKNIFTVEIGACKGAEQRAHPAQPMEKQPGVGFGFRWRGLHELGIAVAAVVQRLGQQHRVGKLRRRQLVQQNILLHFPRLVQKAPGLGGDDAGRAAVLVGVPLPALNFYNRAQFPPVKKRRAQLLPVRIHAAQQLGQHFAELPDTVYQLRFQKRRGAEQQLRVGLQLFRQRTRRPVPKFLCGKVGVPCKDGVRLCQLLTEQGFQRVAHKRVQRSEQEHPRVNPCGIGQRLLLRAGVVPEGFLPALHHREQDGIIGFFQTARFRREIWFHRTSSFFSFDGTWMITL